MSDCIAGTDILPRLKMLRKELADQTFTADYPTSCLYINADARDALITALDGALRALSVPPAAQGEAEPVAIKPLEWRNPRGDDTVWASGILGTQYFASSRGWGMRNYPDHVLVEGGIEAAKAGAQTHYERQIRSTLSPRPTPPADAAGVREAVQHARSNLDMVLADDTESANRIVAVALSLDEALAALTAAPSPPSAPAGWRPTHRHKKRGSDYEMLGVGCIQTDLLLDDMALVVIYRAEDGTLWARRRAEFFDGRFEEIPR